MSNRDRKRFEQYFRYCKYCGEGFYTQARQGRVCEDCKQKGKSGKVWVVREE